MHRAALLLLLIVPFAAWGDAQSVALDLAMTSAAGQVEERLRVLDPELRRIEVTPVARGLRVPMDTQEFHVRLPAKVQLASRVGGWVDFVRNSGVRTSMPVWFDVRASKQVATAARDLRVHEVLADDAVVVREVNVEGVRIAELFKDQPGRFRTTRFISAGRPLGKADVEQVPPVVAQQAVAVRVVSGTVVIDTTAVAEQEGRIGQIIRVRNQTNTARYMALVTGNQQVEASVQ